MGNLLNEFLPFLQLITNQTQQKYTVCGSLLTADGKSQAWPPVIHSTSWDAVPCTMRCTVLPGTHTIPNNRKPGSNAGPEPTKCI